MAQDTERRAHPRHEVSLPVRFRTAGAGEHRGIVTSIAAGGLFIKAPIEAEIGEELTLDVGLGKSHGRVVCSGRVVNLNRKYGLVIHKGLGVKFDDPPADLEPRLASFVESYPGPVKIDENGRAEWPIYAGAERMGAGDDLSGLRFWAGKQWSEAASPEPEMGAGPEPGKPGEPFEAFLRELHAIGLPLGRSNRPEGSFAYHGRALAPQDGVPTDKLSFFFVAADPVEKLGETSGEGSAMILLIAAQMRVVADLEAVGWRIESLGPAEAKALEEGREQMRRHRGKLVAAGRPVAEEDAASPRAQALQAIKSLDAFLTHLLWNARAPEAPVEPEVEIEAPPEQSAAEAAAEASARARRAPARKEEPAAAAKVKATPGGRRKASPATVAAAVILLAIAGVALPYQYMRGKEAIRSVAELPPETLDAEKLAEQYLPVESLSVEGRAVIIETTADWGSLPMAARSSAFTELCTHLANAGYFEAKVLTPTGMGGATWRDGRFDISP